MIDVDEIEDVLKLARRGEPVAHIARTREVSEPTARRYRDVGDPPPRLPHGRDPSSPTLEPFKATIDRRLEEDAETWRRQGHAAARVFARLKGEAGHTGPYPTAQRCVRARGRETAGERDRRDRRGLPELEWRPGECRAGLGEADHRARGAVTRGKCPAASSPHPDVGASQAFWGETPECACEGPKDVSESMGGRAREGRLRQRDRSGEAFRRRHPRRLAPQALLRPPRPRPHPRQPPLGKREGERRGRGGPRQAESLRPHASPFRRGGPRRPPHGQVPRNVTGQSPPGACALREGQAPPPSLPRRRLGVWGGRWGGATSGGSLPRAEPIATPRGRRSRGGRPASPSAPRSWAQARGAIATHGRQRRDVPTGPSGPVPQLRSLVPRPGGREDGIAREGLPKGPASSSTDGADGASGATPGPCATRAPSSAGRRRSRP